MQQSSCSSAVERVLHYASKLGLWQSVQGVQTLHTPESTQASKATSSSFLSCGSILCRAQHMRFLFHETAMHCCGFSSTAQWGTECAHTGLLP